MEFGTEQFESADETPYCFVKCKVLDLTSSILIAVQERIWHLCLVTMRDAERVCVCV